jgi:alanine dehydrogenase
VSSVETSAAPAPASAASTPHPVFVSADACKTVLRWDEMVDRLRQAYSVPLSDKVSPPRTVARGERTWIRALAAAPPSTRYMGAKVFGMSRDKRVGYTIALMDQQSGGFAGLLDAYYVTSFRTGATSAVAVDRLATPGPKTVAVLGSGSEANSHTLALKEVRPISSLRVFSPTAQNREAFAARMQTEQDIPGVAVASAEEAVKGADIVVACARSRDETPILYGQWLRPGMVVVSIGSTLPEQREIDASVVDACDLIVCDMPEEVIDETGDMIAAKAAGIAFDHKIASLNDLMLGNLADRVKAARIPMFKSIGAGLQDIVIAELAFERAIERGLGITLPIEFQIRRTGK